MFGRKKVSPPPQQRPAKIEGPDSLSAAAQYLGFISPPDPVFIDGLSSAEPCFRGDEVGLCCTYNSSRGQTGKVYFFENFASVWADGEPRPRAQIPTEMIAARVAGYAEALSEGLKPGAAHALLAQTKAMRDRLG